MFCLVCNVLDMRGLVAMRKEVGHKRIFLIMPEIQFIAMETRVFSRAFAVVL